MSRRDASEWYKSYSKEFQGFKDRNAMDIVSRKNCVEVLHSLTRNKYKTKDGVLECHKTPWCI